MFRAFILILITLSLMSVAILWMAIDNQPTVTVQSGRQIESADSVNALLNQVRNAVRDRHSSQVIFITGEQLDSLSGVVKRALPTIASKVELSQNTGVVKISYQLPAPLSEYYLNLSMPVMAADNLEIGQVDVGRLTLPGDFVRWAIVALGDWYTGSDIASQGVSQIRSIDFSEAQARLHIGPVDTLIRALKEASNGIGSEDSEELRQRTAHYVSFLNRLPREFSLKQRSLADYLQKVMAEAQRRTVPGQSILENEAALLALAIYAGNHRFASFIGNVHYYPDRAARPLRWPVLAGREDLSLHFLYSLAIKLLSEQGISLAIGEFKELMDRSPTGSGYSFVDMAADMAGVELAQAAMDPTQARRVQRLLATSSMESTFFPDIFGLPEGMDKQRFAQQFGEVDSPEYQRMLDSIRQRISRLPLYSSAAQTAP